MKKEHQCEGNGKPAFVIAYLAVAVSGGFMGIFIGLFLGWIFWR